MEIEVTPPVIPAFTQIGPLEQYSVSPALPATSDNGITGTWNPATISTATLGTFTYTFTPAVGQCATVATMIIEVTNTGSVSDIDGNVYKTVKIGEQWWMAENLKTTKYNNGDLIGTTSPATLDISAESTPKYQWAYNGNESYVETYGRLYTWYSATDSRGICPIGWHVPSDADFTTLVSFLANNGYGFQGIGSAIAKSMAAKSGWDTDPIPGNVGNDQGSNNSSGFTALPGGNRLINGNFINLGYSTSWWNSSENGSTTAWFLALFSNQRTRTRSVDFKKNAFSVRCVKNN
jgi:uncharacterized protein (TIGR02145 family)